MSLLSFLKNTVTRRKCRQRVTERTGDPRTHEPSASEVRVERRLASLPTSVDPRYIGFNPPEKVLHEKRRGVVRLSGRPRRRDREEEASGEKLHRLREFLDSDTCYSCISHQVPRSQSPTGSCLRERAARRPRPRRRPTRFRS